MIQIKSKFIGDLIDKGCQMMSDLLQGCQMMSDLLQGCQMFQFFACLCYLLDLVPINSLKLPINCMYHVVCSMAVF